LAKILIRLKNLLTVFLTDNPDPKASPILISLTSFTAEMSERNVRGGGNSRIPHCSTHTHSVWIAGMVGDEPFPANRSTLLPADYCLRRSRSPINRQTLTQGVSLHCPVPAYTHNKTNCYSGMRGVDVRHFCRSRINGKTFNRRSYILTIETLQTHQRLNRWTFHSMLICLSAESRRL